MYDNNRNRENKNEDLIDISKDSCLILRNLTIEFDEQLYSVKIQLKTQFNILREKEEELKERERTKVHNLDLFSPNYTNAYDTKELISIIDQIKIKMEILNQEQLILTDKISGLKLVTLGIENSIKGISNIEAEKVSNSRQRISDKGLGILEAQEMERQRIARDLHDSTVQNLTSLVHKSELCIKLIDIDSIRAKLELTAMSNTIKTVINDMRGIIYNLKPMSLDDLGLTITVERYANRLMDQNNVQVVVRSNEETKEILPVIKVTLFRIIQEACCNVVKHANASIINIDIRYEEHNIVVSIKDNGSGFNNLELHEDIIEQSTSFGISIMRERIKLLSGSIDIHSAEGKGTIVTIYAPLTICEGDKNE